MTVKHFFMVFNASGDHSESQNGVQVAPGGQFGGANGVQVALGGQFEGPNGVQVALGGQFEGPNGVQVALGGVQMALGVHLESLLLHFKPLRSIACVRPFTTTEGMIYTYIYI